MWRSGCDSARIKLVLNVITLYMMDLTLPGILMGSLSYIGHRTKSVKYYILHSPIYSTCHRVISCSSSSSLYVPDSNRMTLTSSRAHPKVSRTSGSGNFWEEWTFSGKKNKKHFQHVETTARRREAVRFMGNVTLWKIQTLTLLMLTLELVVVLHPPPIRLNHQNKMNVSSKCNSKCSLSDMGY